MTPKSALIVVDLQNDFLPGGSLAVNDGDKIINIINDISHLFNVVIFTQDWHPADHKSFASQHEGNNVFDIIDLNGLQQILWPDHCVQHTIGAEISKGINMNLKNEYYFFKKGLNSEVDSYSGFYDNGRKNSTGLSEFLKEKEVTNVFICGLALDYCCLYTAIDSAKEGFQTSFIIDATKPVNPNSVENCKKQLRENNIDIVYSWEIIKK